MEEKKEFFDTDYAERDSWLASFRKKAWIGMRGHGVRVQARIRARRGKVAGGLEEHRVSTRCCYGAL